MEKSISSVDHILAANEAQVNELRRVDAQDFVMTLNNVTIKVVMSGN